MIDRDMIKEVSKGTLIFITSIGKSIWRSTLSILSLIVYSFLLYALMAYYDLVHIEAITAFVVLLNILIDHWRIFWLMFFVSNLIDDWRYKLN